MKPNLISIAVLLLLPFILTGQVTILKNNVSIFGGLTLGNKVVYASPSGQIGFTDGTSGGTVLLPAEKVLIDFNQFGSGVMNNKLYFSGITVANGSELWVTDGTDAGTKQVKDINSGPGNAEIRGPNERGNFAVVNNTLFFEANDGTNGTQLWKSDGTEAGTQLVKKIRTGANPEIMFPSTSDSNYYVYNTFYFAANDGVNGRELWKTNGTEAGTMMVADITTGAASTKFGPSFLSLCGLVVFAADNGINGMELWRSNGTGAGTFMLRDIAPGSLSSFEGQGQRERLNAFTFQSRIFFTAYEGGIETHNNEQLWVTDGSQGGTKAVTNLNHMQGGFHAALSNESQAVIIRNRFYFIVFNFNNIQSSLWSTNGSTAGTSMVKAINSVPPDYGPNYRYPVARTLMPQNPSTNDDEISQVLFKGEKFFFAADDGVNKLQLWVSDGTFSGTQMLMINPNGNAFDFAENSDNFTYEVTADHLYFTGMDTAHGMEPWRSDGTQAGTGLVSDIRPGNASSVPIILGIANGKMIFSGNNGTATNIYKQDQQVVSYASGGPVYVCPGVSFTLNADVAGSTYQWQVKTPSGYFDLTDNANFSGTQGPVLSLINLPSTAYGWELRCVADGNLISRSYTLKFLAYWVGSVSQAWEDPANWHCGGIPDANTDVLIQCQFNSPVISSNANCRTLVIMNKQSLQVAPGYKLTVTREDN